MGLFVNCLVLLSAFLLGNGDQRLAEDFRFRFRVDPVPASTEHAARSVRSPANIPDLVPAGNEAVFVERGNLKRERKILRQKIKG
jgi:hypothetical protein